MEKLLKMKVRALETKVELLDLAGETLVDAMMQKEKATKVKLLKYIDNEIAPKVYQIDKTLERIDRDIRFVEIISK